MLRRVMHPWARSLASMASALHRPTPSNDEIARVGTRKSRTAHATGAILLGVVLAGAASAVAALPTELAPPVPSASPTAPAIDKELRATATDALQGNAQLDGALHDLVDTSGVLGNSVNIEEALDDDNPLGLSVALDETAHARTFLARDLIALIDSETTAHANKNPEATTELLTLREGLIESGEAAFASGTDIARGARIAELLGLLRA